MKNLKFYLLTHVELSVIITIINAILIYVTVYYLHRDGFDLIDISILSVIAGIYLFFTTFFLNVWWINAYRKNSIENDITPLKTIYSILLILLFVTILLLLFDYFFFHFIDNSISYSFAEELGKFMESSGKSSEELDEFREMPFIWQNGAVNFASILIACLFSWIFIKKDGVLFKSKTESYR